MTDHVDDPEWKMKIKEISRQLLKEPTAKTLFETRDKLYELNASCIPATVVLLTLFEELMEHLDADLQHALIHFAAHYDHEIRNGGKSVWHLEAFVANFLSIYARNPMP